jgi:hypothetical protein
MAIAQTINGDLLVYGSIVATGTPQPLTRAQLTQETARYKIQPTDWRVWDAFQTNLPGTAAADDLALIGGTFGSASPVLRTSDAKATTVTQYARCTFQLPAEYVAGQTVVLRLHCGMITTVSDGTATVDAVVYRSDDEAGIGSDLCATAALTINSLTDANKDFTITAASLSPGDTLDVRVVIAITDAATGTAVIGQIGSAEFLLGVKG